MKVNNPKQYQPDLLEVFPEHEFATPGSARAFYGIAMETLACRALGLTGIPINGQFEINFDAKKGVVFFEIKSVRDLPSSKSIIYDWRIKKEKESGCCLRYCFGLHKVKKAKSNAELWDEFERTGIRFIITPAARVHRLALDQPLILHKETTNPHGYNRKGYCEGYRNLPIGRVVVETPLKIESKTINIYGRKIPVTITHTHEK